ncbi:RidA family protein [Saccharothrix violaceirubra]|uniref:Enamine deaminase RidA (YjgF/YER057c/UK114 family) n=1 Tax=Saccharothrix violaceirubra TaxID=413306 RepID=A0A7W7WWB9_9PSEU|nr:Rid family hydrolase [Saccharothrix violaceirubra]MBB4966200.1 enamine deaminase RidA (YjgF/YER057c/UK114 family) [Saccharothrix violaceirubra]
MTVTRINPPGLPQVEAYRQIAVATGSRTVYVAGQVAVEADGTLVAAGDLEGQVERCYLNIATALAGAGATFDDVAKVTIYIVDYTPDKLALYNAGVARAAEKLGVRPLAAGTLIGVTALASPDFLVEVDAVAVVD